MTPRPDDAPLRQPPRRRFLKTTGGLLAGAALLPRTGLAASPPAVAGPVWLPGDPQYDVQRLGMGWQAWKTDRRPDLIVQATSAQDVVAAVRHARANGLKVAVRSGGHSWVHASVRDGGMLLDLSRLRDLEVAADGGTATVGPGLRSRELITQLAPHGRAFPVAHCGSVALGGYLLGGGSAWNGRSWGDVACFSVTGIDVVTAAGDLVHASERENADLFWAARGAGPGFFGAVTRFHLKLYPLPTAITGASWLWSLDRAPEVAARLQAAEKDLPDAVETLMFLASAPEPLQAQCAPHGRMCAVSATAFVNDAAEGRALLAPLAAALPAADAIAVTAPAPTTFEALFAAVDHAFAPNRFAADTLWSDAPLGDLIERIREPFVRTPAPWSTVLCEARRKPRPYPDAAYSVFAPSFLSVYSIWTDPAADAPGFAALRDMMAAVEPLGSGFYVNESDLTVADRAERSYAPAAWARLKALRRTWDPDRLFHWYPGRPQDE